jgi:hypothetical protein
LRLVRFSVAKKHSVLVNLLHLMLARSLPLCCTTSHPMSIQLFRSLYKHIEQLILMQRIHVLLLVMEIACGPMPLSFDPTATTLFYSSLG